MTVRSGSTPEGYETRAMYLLQAAVIDRARERGFPELNLGGVPEAAAAEGHPEHGLYDFKKGFGAAPCLRTGLTVDL
jgi:lipid II:glycine glycyltransferase (peptidoglycan interpeptide bridge formation enzyme)